MPRLEPSQGTLLSALSKSEQERGSRSRREPQEDSPGGPRTNLNPNQLQKIKKKASKRMNRRSVWMLSTRYLDNLIYQDSTMASYMDASLEYQGPTFQSKMRWLSKDPEFMISKGQKSMGKGKALFQQDGQKWQNSDRATTDKPSLKGLD